MSDENINSGAGDAGVQTAPWYNGADPDTVGFIQNKGWDNPLKAIEAYRGLEKHIGVPADQLLKLPSADDAAAWDGLYKKLGKPESADKYGEVKAPEGVNLDMDRIKHFDNVFYNANLTAAQRKAVVDAVIEYEKNFTENYTKDLQMEKQRQVEALNKEWGAKAPERLELAKRLIRSGVPEGMDKDQFLTAMEDAVGPMAFAKFFANLADKMGEDKFHDDAQSGGGDRFGYTKEQAINDKNTLMAELGKDHKRLSEYNQGRGPDYDRMKKLNEFIFGT